MLSKCNMIPLLLLLEESELEEPELEDPELDSLAACPGSSASASIGACESLLGQGSIGSCSLQLQCSKVMASTQDFS